MAKIPRSVNYDSAPISIPTFASTLGISISSGQRIHIVATGEIYAVLRNAAGSELFSAIVEKDLLSSAAALGGGGGGTDANAVHVNEANEISGIAEKTATVDDDIIIIEDSENSFIKKKVKKSNFAGSVGPENTIVNVNSNTTITNESQVVITDTSGGAKAHNLPATHTAGVLIVCIGDATSETNNITINGNGNTINLASSYVITEENAAKAFLSDGTNWHIFSGYENIFYIEDGVVKTRNDITINANTLAGVSGASFTKDDTEVDVTAPNDTISANVEHISDYWINVGTDPYSQWDLNAYIDSTDAGMIGAHDFVWCARIRILSGLSDHQVIFSDRNASNGSQLLFVYTTDSLLLSSTNHADVSFDVSSLLDVDIDVVLINDHTGDGEATIWVNGVQGTTNTTTGIPAISTRFRIGADADNATRRFSGRIQYLTTYNSATLTNSPSDWVPSDPTSLTGITKTMFSINGTGQDNAEGFTFSNTVGAPSIVGGFASTDNFIPFDFSLASATQLASGTLNVKDDSGIEVNPLNYNIMWSSDGGTTYSIVYVKSVFILLGLLTSSDDYRFAIQPILGQKIGEVTMSENQTFVEITQNGVEFKINGATEALINATEARFSSQLYSTAFILFSITNSVAVDASTSNVFTHLTTENFTLENPTNLRAGAIYTFIFTQEGTTPRTITYGSAYPSGAPALTATIDKVDVIKFICTDGVNLYLDSAPQLNQS